MGGLERGERGTSRIVGCSWESEDPSPRPSPRGDQVGARVMWLAPLGERRKSCPLKWASRRRWGLPFGESAGTMLRFAKSEENARTPHIKRHPREPPMSNLPNDPLKETFRPQTDPDLD